MANEPHADINKHIANGEFINAMQKIVARRLDVKNIKDKLGMNLFMIPLPDPDLGSTELKSSIKRFIKFLEEKGVNIREKDEFGNNYVHIAVMTHRFSLAQIFDELGVSSTDTNNNGENFFHQLSTHKEVEKAHSFVKYLKSKDIPIENLINTKDNDGLTPLDVATAGSNASEEDSARDIHYNIEFLKLFGAKDTKKSGLSTENESRNSSMNENIDTSSITYSMQHLLLTVPGQTPQTPVIQNQQNDGSSQTASARGFGKSDRN